MFSVYSAPEKLENSTITGHFEFVFSLRKTRTENSRDYRDVIVFKRHRFQMFLRPHEIEKPAFSSFSGLNSFVFVTD